ncbi:membrane progestin receptor gamma isoform X1 [Passer domesticus]|uniref:membrane progestin receptor gamma isoform X1 n=1 Tax=Passer domesticus TaxID=48849 RepID=UPI0030FE912C
MGGAWIFGKFQRGFMESWNGLDWDRTWRWFRSAIPGSQRSCGIPCVSHVEFPVFPCISHVEFLVFPCVSPVEFPVYPMWNSWCFPVYPMWNSLCFPVYTMWNSLCIPCGIPGVSLCIPCGIPGVSLCIPCGIPCVSHVEFLVFPCVSHVEFPVFPCVHHVEFPVYPMWNSRCFPVYPLWNSLCTPCGIPGVSLCIPCGIPCGSLRIPCGIPCVSLCTPCGIPCVSHVEFPVFPRFLEAERPRLSKAFRTLAFVYPYIFDSIPVFYRLSRSAAGSYSEGSLPLHSRHSLCALLTFLSFTSHLPERLAPGSFDFIGHSHQVFHICGILGTLFQLEAISTDMAERRGRLPLPSSLETFGSLGMGAAASLAILGVCFRSLRPEPPSREKSH